MSKDNEELRLIVTKRGEYVLPVSARMTWRERYPGTEPPKGWETWSFWRTPDGIVAARPEEERDA